MKEIKNSGLSEEYIFIDKHIFLKKKDEVFEHIVHTSSLSLY